MKIFKMSRSTYTGSRRLLLLFMFIFYGYVSYAAIPTTLDETVIVDEDQTYTFVELDFSFTDDTDAFKSVRIISIPNAGSLLHGSDLVTLNQEISVIDITNNLLKFTPAANANGNTYATFGFTVIDAANEESTSATMTIDVTAQNDLPTAGSTTLDLNEDNPITIIKTDFQFSDIDGHSFDKIEVLNTVTLGSLENNGSAVGNNEYVSIADIDNGYLIFTPESNGNGDPYTNFTFRVFDSSGENSGEYTISFRVFPVNDLPTSINANFTVTEDIEKAFSLGDFTFDDDDGGVFTKIRISNLNITGTLQLNSTDVSNGDEILTSELPNLIFDPLADENGNSYASFDFEVHDATDYSSSAYTMTIDVTVVNDPPTINPVDDPANIFEDAIEQTITVAGISGGANEPAPTVTVSSDTPGLIPTPSILYNSGTGEAEVKYTPVANQNGTAIITVTVDDGETSIDEFWTVNVVAVNDQPTITVVSDQSTNEDEELIVDLFGITPGINESGQFITITAESDNASIVPDGAVTYTQGNTTGSITFNPAANAVGVVNITLTLVDDGGTTTPGDINTKIITFELSVVSVNDPPFLDDISSPSAINEDAIQQSIGLSSISDGDPEVVQTLTISATSDNLSLIETIVVEYTNPNTTATLDYTPKSNAYGSADITVVVSDGDKNVQKTFTVVVDAVNDPPTLDAFGVISDINEDSAEKSIDLLNITPGPNEASQSVTVTASSNLPGIIPHPTVVYTPGNNFGSILYTPEPDQFGDVIITVTVTDNDANQKNTTQSFTQVVVPVNDPPTIGTIGNISINEDSGLQTITLSGITDDGQIPKNLTVTALSDDITIVPNPVVNYTSPNENGSIDFTPNPNKFGTINITVKVTDKDALIIEETFEIEIININDPPELGDIPIQSSILEDAGPQSINLVGISAGPNENETVSISAASDNLLLIINPTVSFTGSTGTLFYTPIDDASGTATITVQVNDGQGINNLIEKSVEINVSPVNDAPYFEIIGNQAVSENSGLVTVNAFATNMEDGALEDQILTFQTTTDAPTGNLQFDTSPTIDLATGNLTFEPSPNSNGNVTVNVTLLDNGGTDNGGINQFVESFIIYVTAVNDPPTFTLNGIPPDINEDAGTITETAFAQNIDDGDPELNQDLTFNISLASGSLTFDDFPTIDATSGDLNYTVGANENGTATFNVQLEETATSKVSTSSQFTISVNAVNDPPVGSDGAISFNEDNTYTFQTGDFVFSDIDNHVFDGIQVTAIPLAGELKYNGSAVSVGPGYTDVTLLTFTPGSDENGVGYTSFTFKVQDESGDNSILSYTMDIDVTAISDNPTSDNNGFISTPEDQEYTFSEIDFPYNDTDNDAFDGIIIQSNVALGTLLEGSTAISGFPKTISNVTLLKFQPLASGNGTPYTSFTFDVLDASGASSVNDGPYTMSINVGAVSDPPTGSDETITMLEDQTYTFQASNFTFNDADGDTFEGVQITELESLGILKYDDIDVVALDECPDITKLTYTPPANQNGSPLATFKFKVRDNSGALNISTSSYTMTINVTDVNDAPIFTITENPPVINEDAGAQIVSSFISTIDDGDPETTQTLTFNISFDTNHPTLSFSANPSIDVANGDLSYTIASDSYGTITIDVTLSDNGGTANGGSSQSSSQQFTITVNPINDLPMLDDISGTYNINEDAASLNIDLSGINAGSNEDQTITVEASSSDINIIPNPAVTYTSPNSAGQLTLTFVANANGIVDITVTVKDDQATNNSVSKVFQVTVNAVNDPPTLDLINNPIAIIEDAGLQTIDISGITAGANETQVLQVITSSADPAIIPHPSVNYTSANAIGSISYTPVPDMSGIVEISVTVQDDAASNNTIERKFNVEVIAVNDQPTIDDLPALPIEINEDAETQTLLLKGITAGGGESQSLIISATSESPDIISTPTIGSISNGEATLSYAPTSDKNGLVKITVTVNDGQAVNNTISKDFYVDIKPINDLPTLDPITGNPFSINEDSPIQNVSLTGISPGGGEDQTLSIYATSSDESIVPNPSISYTQGNSVAVLSYTPVSDISGQVTITVFVDDLNGSNNLKSETFVINVIEINDLPTIADIISPGDILEDASEQTVSLSGITAGGGENQTVTVTAISLNPSIIGDPIVNYSGNNNASLLFTPLPNANGTATIEVTIDDGQSVNNQIKKTFEVNVLKVNDLPTMNVISTPYSITEDAGLQTIELTGISQGPNESEQTLTISAVSDNTGLVPNPNINAKTADTRDLVFTPVANKNGTANITVTVDDGQPSNNSITRTFKVEISSVNDPPDFDLQSDINITENSGLNTINGYAYNIDDGDPELTQGLNFDLVISGSLSFKTNPTLSAANGDLVFETSPDSNGEATIVVKLIDNGSPPASSIEKSFKINALPLNGKPSFTLNGNPPSVAEDAGSILVSSYATNIDDGDPELNQTLIFNLIKISGDLNFETNPQIDPINGNLTYETILNSFGSAVISVTISDNGGESSSAQFFTIAVDPINDAPTGSDESVTTAEDTPYTFKTLDFTYNDVEMNTFSGVQIINLENFGDLEYDGIDVVINQICPDVSLLVFKPGLNGNGNNYAVFDFKLRDSQGMLSITYKMTFNVTPEDDNPTTSPGDVNTQENTDYTFSEIDFPFNDPDGDSFTAIRIYSVETRGDLEYNLTDVVTGAEITDFSKLVFKPAPSENGTPYSTFEFQVKDSKGAYSLENIMSINVGSVNDRPTGDHESVTTLEDNNYVFNVSDFTFNDVDGHLFDGIRIESLETNGDLEYDGNDVTLQTACPDVTKLVFNPDQNANGSNYATFSFKVKDNSSSQNFSSSNYTMTINVTSVNDRPVFTFIGNPPSINEDAETQSTTIISSINDGDPDQTQNLQFSSLTNTGTTGSLSFSTSPTVDLSGTLSYRATANTNGSATFSFYLTDDGGTSNGGQNQSINQSITITVNSLNDFPTINPIADQPAIPEDAGTQTVNMANITAGPLESQSISINAVSSNTSLIPTPTVSYTSPNNIGSISYSPALDQSGTSIITITVDDGELTNGEITETFLVTVNPVNDPPTINDIPDPDPILENAGEQIINLDGITAGGGENQPLQLSVLSSNLTLIPAPNLTYLGGSTAQIAYTPEENINGESIITVTVDDNNGGITNKSFNVIVSTVNDPPRLDLIPNPTPILEDSPEQQILLTGISPGTNEIQILKFDTESSNLDLLSTISIDYNDPSTTGVLSYTTNENQFGATIITVTIDDGSLINNLVSRQFTVEVLPVPDSPIVSAASTDQGVQSNSGLIIQRNVNDGDEVAYFKITNIQNGTLYLQDGSTEIINGEFVPFEQAILGFRFTPDSNLDGTFEVQSSLNDSQEGLGGALAIATIFINSIPTTTNLPDLTLDEDSPQIIFDLFSTFDDQEDLDIELLFEANNTAPEVVDVSISGQNLIIDFVENKFGIAFITIKCTDSKGAFVEDEIILTVNSVNDAPTFDSQPVTVGEQDVEYQYQIITSDIEGDARYFELTAPQWLSITDNGDGTATLTGTPGEDENGNHNVEIIITESETQIQNSQIFTININNVNDAPFFVSEPPTEILENEKYEYIVEISDPDANDSFTVDIDPTKPNWLVFHDQEPYKLEGFAPEGSAGSYDITLFVIDEGGLMAEQNFTIVVSTQNNKPIIQNLSEIDLEEGQAYIFTLDEFIQAFSDDDINDTLSFITIVELPLNGVLTLNGTTLQESDTIYRNDINKLVYTPDASFNGVNFFTWNASDGKALAQVPARVLFNISSVDDAPQIINLETNSIIYNFGDYNTLITEMAEVIESDDGRIASANISITSNYQDDQDSLSISIFDGISSEWNDTTGVLSINGIKNAEIYQEVLRSIIYTNQKRFSPNTSTRDIELIVSDGGLQSIPVYRKIEFEDTFIELEIPSGFTPNQDDVNDTWEIENIDTHDDALVRVYSREGILLYESKGYYKEWDGAFNGSLSKPGVYYYTIEIVKFERKYSGTITILR